jgi:hypothetical protein
VYKKPNGCSATGALSPGPDHQQPTTTYFIPFPSGIEVEGFRCAEDTDYIIIFFSEDGSSSFVRNICNNLYECMLPQLRRTLSTLIKVFPNKVQRGLFGPFSIMYAIQFAPSQITATILKGKFESV